MEEIIECPSCSGQFLEFFLQCTDYTVSKEDFSIVTCKSCGFLFTNPRPGENEIVKYYESDDYVSHSDTKSGVINKIYHLIKNFAIKNKFELVANLKPKTHKLLDIGCGTGSFLGIFKQNKWEVTGIEPNTKARQLAIDNFRVNVFGEEKINTLPKNHYSVISMWHVLEHVHKLKKRIEEIFELLEKDGYAIIAVPNHTSWDAKHYRMMWAAYDVPRHLYHFSPKTIKELFDDKRFTHVKSLPMKFDSYYVSLLSEKYKGSALKLFKAFFIGMYSNMRAKNNPEKYSSVIYIFQKK